MPATTNDLEVALQGPLLILDLGYPQSTASGEVLPGIEAIEVLNVELEGVDPATAAPLEPLLFEHQAQSITTVDGVELESATSGDRIVLRVPLRRSEAEASSTEPAIEAFAVRTVSSTGEVSAISNQAILVMTPPPPPPGGLSASTRADGILLSWQGGDSESSVRVYRRRPFERRYGDPIATVDPGEESYQDGSAVLGESYFYLLRGLAHGDARIESAASNEIEVDYRDLFPPEPPASVIALAEASSVRLVIEGSPSPDVAGYLVYRRDQGADFRAVVSEPLPAAGEGAIEYTDRGLVAGQSYSYRVTAVDEAGNEGEAGEEVRVTVP